MGILSNRGASLINVVLWFLALNQFLVISWISSQTYQIGCWNEQVPAIPRLGGSSLTSSCFPGSVSSPCGSDWLPEAGYLRVGRGSLWWEPNSSDAQECISSRKKNVIHYSFSLYSIPTHVENNYFLSAWILRFKYWELLSIAKIYYEFLIFSEWNNIDIWLSLTRSSTSAIQMSSSCQSQPT